MTSHCEHSSVYYIPYGAVSWDQALGSWCPTCGQLRMKVDHGIMIMDKVKTGEKKRKVDE